MLSSLGLSEIIATNTEIRSTSDSSKVFFQPTPVPSIFTIGEMTVEIPAVETVEQIPEMMAKVLTMIIPVGLVVFGIVLVILLIKLVISRAT